MQAQAADLRAGGAGAAIAYDAAPVRAGQYYIYDDEPGVYVRAYWAAPWQNRHYFPFTGKKPKVGRHERLSAKRPAPKPAESYYRAWSTVSLYPPQRRDAAARQYAAADLERNHAIFRASEVMS